MKKFEVGKQYMMRSIGDHDCIWTYMVTDRTAQTVTLEDMDTHKVTKCRINKYITEMSGAEAVYPLGRYSFSPILRAINETC